MDISIADLEAMHARAEVEREAAKTALLAACSHYPGLAIEARDIFKAPMSEVSYRLYMERVSLYADTLSAHLTYEAANERSIQLGSLLSRRRSLVSRGLEAAS